MRPKYNRNNWIYRLNIMEELELNHTYLLQFGSGDHLSSVTILMVTDKAYYIQWNNGMNNTWEQKKVFNRNYSMVEDISNFIIKKSDITHVKTKFKTCPICHGFGHIPDDKSTAGSITCPLCHGSKMIPEIIET